MWLVTPLPDMPSSQLWQPQHCEALCQSLAKGWCGEARLLRGQHGAQVFVPSKDGSVKIPMFIVHHKDVVFDGSNPTYLYAYGGGNDSLPFLVLQSVIRWRPTSGWTGHTHVYFLSAQRWWCHHASQSRP